MTKIGCGGGTALLLCNFSGDAFLRGTCGSGDRTLLGQLKEGVPDVGECGGDAADDKGE